MDAQTQQVVLLGLNALRGDLEMVIGLAFGFCFALVIVAPWFQR